MSMVRTRAWSYGLNWLYQAESGLHLMGMVKSMELRFNTVMYVCIPYDQD